MLIAGHAPLAFAIAGWGAHAVGLPRRRALAIALVAGGFALVPDVDILHAVAGLIVAAPADVWRVNEAFWTASRAVHRGLTHSLLLGVPAAAGFGLLAGGRRARLAGCAVLCVLAAAGFAVAGLLGFALAALYALLGAAVVGLGHKAGLGVRATLGAALVGLGTHPFGDLFTGTPPEFLYPVRAVAPARIILHPDPTLNLLAVFGLELGAVWLGLLVAVRLRETALRRYVDRHAALGSGYGAAALILPPPTLEVAAPFAFSVLAVGVVGIVPIAGRVDTGTLSRGFVTGVAAVTLGGLGYAVAYLLL